MKLSKPQKQALVSIGVFGHKASIGNTVAYNLQEKGFIEYDNAYLAWFLTDKGQDYFCYQMVISGMDPFGDDLPDLVKEECYKRYKKWFE